MKNLPDNFIRHLENSEEDRHLASLDAWREFQFRLDFIWSEKLQQDRGLLENHWQDIQKVLEAYNQRIHELLRDTASYHSEAFTAIWNESFQELGAIPGLEKLAQTLHQQSRVLHSLKTEIAARVLRAEGLGDLVLANQAETPEAREMARKMAESLPLPVWAGSLRRGEIVCVS